MVELYQGDCLEQMLNILDHSVDLIVYAICKYGTTDRSGVESKGWQQIL